MINYSLTSSGLHKARNMPRMSRYTCDELRGMEFLTTILLATTAIAIVAGLVYVESQIEKGIDKFIEWLKNRKKQSDDKEHNRVDDALEFIKNVPKSAAISMFKKIQSLKDNEFQSFILDWKQSVITKPDWVMNWMKLSNGLQSEYARLHSLRAHLLNFKPVDVAKGSAAFNRECDKIIAQYGSKQGCGTVGRGDDADEDTYYMVPKRFKPLIEKVFFANDSRIFNATYKEAGWNKSNFKYFADYIIHLCYDTPEFDATRCAQNDKFYGDTVKLLTGMLPYVDWFDGDPNNKDDVEEKLSNIEDDEGAVVYAFGQEVGWITEKPWNDAFYEMSDFMTGVNWLKALCKRFNEIKKHAK